MRRLVLILSLIIVGSLVALSQQLPVFNNGGFGSQFLNSANILNTSIGSIGLNYKSAATGFENSPTTFYFDFNYPVGQNKFSGPSFNLDDNFKSEVKKSLGGYLFYDKYGIVNQFSGMVTYGQRFRINKKTDFVLAVSAGVFNYFYNLNDLTIKDLNDPTFQKYLNGENNFLFGDANFGFNFSFENFRVGGSVRHIMGKKALLTKTELNPDLTLNYLLSFTTKQKINNDLDIIPSFYYSQNFGLPTELTFRLPLVYKRIYYLGPNYTFKLTTGLELGMYYKSMIFGYSFKINTSKFSQIGLTTHELGFKYMLKETRVNLADELF